ncbi:MAG: PKD domain-containing protein, partial [Bacteroidia bacterium]
RIQFKENSSVGADNAKIIRYTWDLGDGDTSNRKDPKYAYEINKKFKVLLEVLDENGCKDTVSKTIKYYKYKRIIPNFRKFQKDSCPVTEVVFKNRTDTTGLNITGVEWVLGNGTIQKSKKSDADWSDKWSSAKATYTGNKTYFPSITVSNRIGCEATFSRYAIENIFFKFNATASPDSICYGSEEGPVVQFSQPEVKGYRSVVWVFGDPNSISNSAANQFEPQHQYSEPGTFAVTLRIEKKGCVRDTKYCAMVKVYGPKARINKYPEKYNDSLIGHDFYPNFFPEKFDSCFYDSLVYFTLDTQKVKKSRFIYCNAVRADSIPYQLMSKCKGSFSRYYYKLQPTQTITYLGNKITRKRHVWRKGDDFPNEKVFREYVGNSIPENLHDTFIFAKGCTVPHTVNFINNTIKYRGYEALDNFTPTYPDSCRNPSHPWASDSLQYFWDFGEGSLDTATALNPDSFSRFSTLRLPIHTYTVEGCYYAKLWAVDSKTGCESFDSLAITVQPPNAGWDTIAFDTIKRMDYRTQNKLQGTPYRRGMILKGLECANYKQTIDIKELLPACQLEKYWVVFDSAAQTTYTVCNGDTVLHHQWIESLKVPKAQQTYSYETTGWKTVGIVVKNGDCFDTMWYHNYKYIYSANARATFSNIHFCKGDTVSVQLIDTLQEGIKFVWFEYEKRKSVNDDWKLLATDTLDFLNYNKNGIKRKITSTIKNHESNVVDDTTYNNLAQKSHYVFAEDGIYRIRVHILHRFGCEYIEEYELPVGHTAKFGAVHDTVCLGDSVVFKDSVNYYRGFLNTNNKYGINKTMFWNDPIGLRGGIVPRNPERIEWDFNGDGIWDAKGSNPKWSYAKPGIYTVSIRTMDSMACGWLITTMPNYIKVVGIETRFSPANDDTVRFCAPQLFVFKDKTIVDDGGNGGVDYIRYWRWTWGDGEEALRSKLDDGTTGHLYEHNGVYTVKLKTYLSNYFRTKGKGCIDSTEVNVLIEGPLPKFSLVGDSVGCVPFLATVQDTSAKTSVWEWHLGNGRTKPSFGEKYVNLGYPEPGTYCISLYAGDSIVDFEGKKLFCVDHYPHKKCDIKVRVLPKNKIVLNHDSLLCLNEIGAFNFEKSDSTYTNYTISISPSDKNIDIIDKF